MIAQYLRRTSERCPSARGNPENPPVTRELFLDLRQPLKRPTIVVDELRNLLVGLIEDHRIVSVGVRQVQIPAQLPNRISRNVGSLVAIVDLYPIAPSLDVDAIARARILEKRLLR